jgi:plastocyanin
MSAISNKSTTHRKTSVLRALAAAALAIGLLVACRPSSEPSGNVAREAAPEGAVEVVAADNSFDPEVLELPAGKEVTVQVTNNGGTAHDFAIESMDLNTGTIEPEKSASATFTVPDDAVEFVCTIHSGMGGRIEPQ